MLVLFVDIAEGEYMGHFKRALERAKAWNSEKRWDNSGIYRQLLTDNNGRLAPHFKGLLTIIENSNSGYHVNSANFDPRDLVGKHCGFLFGEEEFVKYDSSIGRRIIITQPLTTIEVDNNNYKIPELKKLPVENPHPQPDIPPSDNFGGSPIDPSDIPF